MDINELIKRGSSPFTAYEGVVGAGLTVWNDKDTLFADYPDVRYYDYLDYLLVQNNSAQIIEVYLNTPNEMWAILPYNIQPITGKAFRQFGVRNTGLADTVANDIIYTAKRLPQTALQTVGL